MNILFLHGLDSQPFEDRKKVLSQYGTVDMPHIDYRNQSDIYNTYYQQAILNKCDLIIGHSLGGVLAYYIGRSLNIPYLLFMPAFSSGNLKLLSIPENLATPKKHFKELAVISKNDQVIDNSKTYNFIGANNIIEIESNGDKGHSLSPTTLQQYTEQFLNKNTNESYRMITSILEFGQAMQRASLFNISTIKKEIEIEMNIQHTVHSIERSRRHGSTQDFISNDDIKSAVSTATETIVSLIIENEINVGDSILISRASDNLNVVGTINLKTKEDDSLVFRVVTVMRKVGFKPKDDTYTIDI